MTQQPHMAGSISAGIGNHARGSQSSAKDKHHKRRWYQVLNSPCHRPPEAPTGVVLTFRAREALTHLRFDAKIKWNEVSDDSSGFPISIDGYEVQWVPTNAGGVIVETEDGKTRHHRAVKAKPSWAPISAASIVSGTTAEFTTKRKHGFSNGDLVVVGGMVPSGYNGTWTITTTPTAWKFRADIGTSPAAATDFGQVQDADDTYHVITGVLPQPKTLYWKARVRAHSVEGCWGLWSAWTAVGLPWTGADPTPPAPTLFSPAISFDRIGKGKRRHFRLKAKFYEVTNWDVPGGDTEDDMRAYQVVIDRSDDASAWDGSPWYRKKLVMAKQDDDADTTRTVNFRVSPKQWYRYKVRSIDRFNRHGAWSSWSDAALPNDNVTPPTPLQVLIHGTSTDRVVLNWDKPVIDYPTRGTVAGTSGTATLTGTDTKFTIEIGTGTVVKVDNNSYTVKAVASDTSLTLTGNLSTSPTISVLYEVEEHYDVEHYEAQIAKLADVNTGPTPDDWSVVYMRDKTRGTRKAFKVLAADENGTFYGRVRSVDMAGNKSAWVAGRTTPNDSTTADGMAVVIGKGAGKTKIVWSVLGRVRVLAEANTHDYDMDEGLTTLKVRARVKVAPVGANLIVGLYKNNSSIGVVTIAAGSKRGVNDAIATTWVDSDIFSCSIDQVGSSFAGRQLTVVHVLS